MIEAIKQGEYIFVYGTLRKGERADLSREQSHFSAQFVGEDRIAGVLYNLGSYPGVKNASDFENSAIPAAGVEAGSSLSETITGEVFRARDDSLGQVLDAYEGFPYLYNREQVTTENGRLVWVYTYNDDVPAEKLIPSGDWKARHVVEASREAMDSSKKEAA